MITIVFNIGHKTFCCIYIEYCTARTVLIIRRTYALTVGGATTSSVVKYYDMIYYDSVLLYYYYYLL